MPPYVWFLICVVFLIVSFLIYQKVRDKMALDKIELALKSICDEVLRVEKNPAFDFECLKNGRKYLIKTVFFYCQDEININSKNYWQANHGAVSSRKKGEKMPNVYDLVHYNLEANGYDNNTKKIYVIYPKASTLMKVINECEMVLIKPNVDCHGTKVTNFSDLIRDFDLF